MIERAREAEADPYDDERATQFQADPPAVHRTDCIADEMAGLASAELDLLAAQLANADAELA